MTPLALASLYLLISLHLGRRWARAAERRRATVWWEREEVR